jgi:hypothetical protein
VYYYSIWFCIIIRSTNIEHNKNSSISKTAKERERAKRAKRAKNAQKSESPP